MKQHALVTVGSILLLFLGSLLGHYLLVGVLPNFTNQLCQYDCNWYQSIIQSGYIFDAEKQNNVAFFPLYPFTWKVLGFSVVWMSLLNIVIYIASMLLVCKQLNIPIKSTLIFCLAGMITFLLVPYSESFFFAASAFMLVGFYNKQHSLLFAGICLAIFTRSASMIFIIAFCTMIILAIINGEQKTLLKYGIAIFLSVVCTAIVFAIHYSYTGLWNGFFISQSHWDFKLQFPRIPFLQGAWPITLFDSNALLIGLSSAALLIVYTINCLFNQKNKVIIFAEKLKPHELFSLLYLAGCTFIVVLFLGGSLRSLGRFVFSTPFYLVFITLFVTKRIQINWSWQLLGIVGVVVILLLPKGIYLEHNLLLVANSTALGWLIFFDTQQQTTKIKLGMAAIFIWGMAQQIIALIGFLRGEWMG